jgi:hypothetical protein
VFEGIDTEGIDAERDPTEEGDRSLNGDSSLTFGMGIGVVISSGTEV